MSGPNWREALNDLAWAYHSEQDHPDPRGMCPEPRCQQADRVLREPLAASPAVPDDGLREALAEAWRGHKSGVSWTTPESQCRDETPSEHARHLVFVQGWYAALDRADEGESRLREADRGGGPQLARGGWHYQDCWQRWANGNHDGVIACICYPRSPA